jgi:hypothetical protein
MEGGAWKVGSGKLGVGKMGKGGRISKAERPRVEKRMEQIGERDGLAALVS